MTAEFELLKFDTELFGFKVVKILSPRLTNIELQTLLMQLGTQDVRLVYWSSDSADAASQTAARQMQGFLGSQQITYAMSLRTLSSKISTPLEVEQYRDNEIHASLENLAIQAGNYSHFNLDPKFPSHLFLKLYITWVHNSIKGIAAEAMWVVRRGASIVGMISVDRKHGCGYIGLLAVATDYRGQNIGTHLVQAAQAYWRNQGLEEGRVVTQVANKPACRLYEKCGFKSIKVENFYHFWL